MNAQRRRFMRAAAAGGLAYAFGRTPDTIWAQAAGVGGFSDYKALVCVFLFGGNDSWNMVVPTSMDAYAEYSLSRGGPAGVGSGLAIPKDQLLQLNLLTPDTLGRTFGMHPSMGGTQSYNGGMQALFNSGKCAVVANVGPLLQPTTKTQYQQQLVQLPPQLFSHNDQQDQWHSLRGRSLLKSGWGGRVADVLAAQLPGQQLATNVSLAGQTLFQAGEQATPYVMGSSGATTFTGFGTAGVTLGRRQAFEAVTSASYGDIYERGFAAVQKRAVQYADLVNSTLTATDSTPFIALPNTGVTLSPLATQLRTVAKMIKQQATLGMSRQIFFVSTGGFDSHDNQVTDQPNLLANVSDSLKRFYDAMVEIGMQNMVTAFTHSDFGRTLTSNGDGSDHAWGGVQLVMGGAVAGQQIYGSYPSLALNSAYDVGGGRFIPTTSADQYAATLARWFGVTDADMVKVAPNIGNFTANKYLTFLG